MISDSDRSHKNTDIKKISGNKGNTRDIFVLQEIQPKPPKN